MLESEIYDRISNLASHSTPGTGSSLWDGKMDELLYVCTAFVDLDRICLQKRKRLKTYLQNTSNFPLLALYLKIFATAGKKGSFAHLF